MKSWDLWDTLITRCVIHPTDVFAIVEIRSGIKGFKDNRIAAEVKSRETVIETTLERIYQFLPYEIKILHQLMEMEIDTEIALVSGITENISKFSSNDIIISDMYLDENILSRAINKCGLNISTNRLFVSCSHNQTKHQGRLFETALQTYPIKIHIGDNIKSDVHSPQKKGINSIHYKDSLPNQLEHLWSKQIGDGNFFSGIIRGARLSNKHTDILKKTEWNLFSQIIAPVLVQFVEWIFDEATKNNINKIYFLSRDGQILYKIADKICKSRHLDFECKYLYVSRQALHLPGHISIEESKSWLLDNTQVLTLRTIANRASIPEKEFFTIARRYFSVSPDSNLASQERHKLCELLHDPEFLALLSISSNRAYELALEYFIQEGLLDNKQNPIAIVDVGWHGRLQRSIDNILTKANYSADQIYGYYFGLFKQCVYPENNRVHGFACSPFFEENPNAWIKDYPSLIELFLAADHPSVHAYARNNGKILPIFHKSNNNSRRILDRQEAILAYTTRYCAISTLINRKLIDHSIFAISAFKNFLKTPSASQALVFFEDQHSEQQFESNFVPFIKFLNLKDTFYRNDGRWGIWPEGSHAVCHRLWLYKTRKVALKVIRHLIPKKHEI